MDANQQRFWLIAAPEQFRLSGTGAQWDASRRVLRLASRRRIEGLSDDRTAARALSDGPPMAIDPFGTWARVLESATRWWSAASPSRSCRSIWSCLADERIADLALAANGILHLALRRADGTGRILLVDRREQGSTRPRSSSAGFSADRLAVAADGRIWALDRAAGRLALIKGEPLPRLAERAFAPDSFRPSEENLDPPRLELLPEVDVRTGTPDPRLRRGRARPRGAALARGRAKRAAADRARPRHAADRSRGRAGGFRCRLARRRSLRPAGGR